MPDIHPSIGCLLPSARCRAGVEVAIEDAKGRPGPEAPALQ
jgi:hypothetical protein